MSFPAVMLILVAVTGIIWLIDSLFLASKRQQQGKEPVIVEYARSFFPIILIVLVVRSFLAEPFRIPSGSMLPTLHIGDFILVNKFAYGVRLPVSHNKILSVGEPERGDVVVFRYPKNPEVDYIKRVVGLPGDRIGYFDKTIYVNGNAVRQEHRKKDGSVERIAPASYQLKNEWLGNIEHKMLHNPARRLYEGEIVVPDGEYFVMGDNRDNSNDSRFWGPVPEENLVGKAFMIWMSWDWAEGGIVWERLGDSIY